MSNRPRCLLASTLIAGLALSVAGSAAARPAVTLSEGFEPHPHVTDLIEVEVDTSESMTGKGWQKCGTSFTTAAPAWTFRLDEPVSDLNIVFTGRTGSAFTSAVLVLENGAYACAKGGNIYLGEAPAGDYEVYYFSSSQGAAATVRLEQPDRLAREVGAALDAAPTVSFAADGPNPRFVELPDTPSAHARVVGTACASGLEMVRPLGRLEVEDEGQYLLRVPGRSLLVESDAGCVIDEATRRDNTLYNDHYQLSPGTYELWTHATADDGPVVLEADDLSQPLDFGEAEVRELGSLEEPRLLSGSTRPAQRWPSRRNACDGARGAARAPDFYLHSDEPVPQVELSLYRDHDDLALRLYGPIERAAPYERMICDEPEQGFRVFEGTYAVWVVDARGAEAGTDYDLLALRTDVEIDPLKTLLPIPEELTLAERAVSDHYPFYGDMSHGYLFLHAPDRLFVYATEGFESQGQQVLPGEPLLVVGASDDRFDLARFDGRTVSAPASRIAASASTVRLPTEASFEPAEDWSGVWRHVTPDDQAAVDRMRAVSDAYKACVGSWMAENDPTWGKGYDMVYTSGADAGRTVTDKKFDEADVACDGDRVEAAEEVFIRTINAAASKRAATHLAEVRERFGL